MLNEATASFRCRGRSPKIASETQETFIAWWTCAGLNCQVFIIIFKQFPPAEFSDYSMAMELLNMEKSVSWRSLSKSNTFSQAGCLVHTMSASVEPFLQLPLVLPFNLCPEFTWMKTSGRNINN